MFLLPKKKGAARDMEDAMDTLDFLEELNKSPRENGPSDAGQISSPPSPKKRFAEGKEHEQGHASEGTATHAQENGHGSEEKLDAKQQHGVSHRKENGEDPNPAKPQAQDHLRSAFRDDSVNDFNIGSSENTKSDLIIKNSNSPTEEAVPSDLHGRGTMSLNSDQDGISHTPNTNGVANGEPSPESSSSIQNQVDPNIEAGDKSITNTPTSPLHHETSSSLTHSARNTSAERNQIDFDTQTPRLIHSDASQPIDIGLASRTPVDVAYNRQLEANTTKPIGGVTSSFGTGHTSTKPLADFTSSIKYNDPPTQQGSSPYVSNPLTERSSHHVEEIQSGRVFVGNIPAEMSNPFNVESTKQLLISIFSKYGTIIESPLIRKGFAFIQFDNDLSANKAVSGETSLILGGHKIDVKVAFKPKSKPDKPPLSSSNYDAPGKRSNTASSMQGSSDRKRPREPVKSYGSQNKRDDDRDRDRGRDADRTRRLNDGRREDARRLNDRRSEREDPRRPDIDDRRNSGWDDRRAYSDRYDDKRGPVYDDRRTERTTIDDDRRNGDAGRKLVDCVVCYASPHFRKYSMGFVEAIEEKGVRAEAIISAKPINTYLASGIRWVVVVDEVRVDRSAVILYDNARRKDGVEIEFWEAAEEIGRAFHEPYVPYRPPEQYSNYGGMPYQYPSGYAPPSSTSHTSTGVPGGVSSAAVPSSMELQNTLVSLIATLSQQAQSQGQAPAQPSYASQQLDNSYYPSNQYLPSSGSALSLSASAPPANTQHQQIHINPKAYSQGHPPNAQFSGSSSRSQY